MKQRLYEHLKHFWPENSLSAFRWEIGPIKGSLPEFLVVRIEPKNEAQPWVYVSVGAWEVPTEFGYREEFFVIAPHEDPIHIENLAMIANLHADKKHTLNVGSIINIGRGWVDGSTCDHFLVSLPYPFGPSLEVCRSNSTVVEILWLMPITNSEASFARQSGVEQLEQRFDDARIDYKDPHRSTVV